MQYPRPTLPPEMLSKVPYFTDNCGAGCCRYTRGFVATPDFSEYPASGVAGCLDLVNATTT